MSPNVWISDPQGETLPAAEKTGKELALKREEGPGKRKPNAPRLATQRAKDLELTASLYLKGRYQSDIATELGVSIATVKRDLAKIRQTWLQSSLRDFDALKAEQLARIDAIETEAWEMWSRSCELQLKPGGVATTTASQGAGNPRYLQIMLQCVERRSKLLGLDAPEKLARTDSTGVNEPISDRFRDMSAEELESRVRELQRKTMDDLTDTEIQEWVDDVTRGRFRAASIGGG